MRFINGEQDNASNPDPVQASCSNYLLALFDPRVGQNLTYFMSLFIESHLIAQPLR
jgi:hypothetical protein